MMPFADVVGPRRHRDDISDQRLLDACMRLPADGATVFADTVRRGRWSGPRFAYRPDSMRVLMEVRDTYDDGSVSDERCYLVAGKADGIGDHPGADAFIVFAVAPLGETGEDDVLLYGERFDLDSALAELACCSENLLGHRDGVPGADRVRANLIDRLRQAGALR